VAGQLPGNGISFHIVPLIPANNAGLAGRVPVNPFRFINSNRHGRNFLSKYLIFRQRVVKTNLYNIFPADFKPVPVKVETMASFRPFALKYFFNPATVAAEVGSIK
jgi:hypothetical protein